MVDNRLVCHEGKVVGIKDNSIQVKILSRSACAQCHARGMCTALDMEEKIIDTVPVSPDPMQIGDTVVVVLEEKLGWRAVFYGFFLPFIVMVTVLFVSYALGSGETKAALYSIGSLIPYYLLLYVFREKIGKDFVFKSEKKDPL
ncbi:MAG: SoxR reducing system RseC family protein [Candidatus Aminicenantes bacterium]|nr:MAG: SoxR reducing system RseC family protein [Candidatus Aminicenantes bacterium]